MTSSVFSAIIYLAFAGVAHLVERDLAKVEVASSSLVARSKKKHHPSGWCFFSVKSGRGSKGREHNEKNMPVACFGARVRVAARQGRQRASSPAPKRKTPVEVSFFLEQHFCSAKVVDSKEQITVIFKGGLKSVQPLTK